MKIFEFLVKFHKYSRLFRNRWNHEIDEKIPENIFVNTKILNLLLDVLQFEYVFRLYLWEMYCVTSSYISDYP